MVAIIQIKRRLGGTAGPPATLNPGELAFQDVVAGTGPANLYVGTTPAAVLTLVAATRQVEITGAQTITGTKTIASTALKITGGASGNILSTDGAGNLSWIAAPGGGNVSNAGTPTNGQWAQWTAATTIQGVNAGALTAVNDTNVTLTLGGTPASALLQAASITAGWTGTLANARLANMAAQTIKMNPTAAAAVPVDQTINGLTAKATPVGADLIILADSAATFGIKQATISSLPSAAVSTDTTMTGNGQAATPLSVIKIATARTIGLTATGGTTITATAASFDGSANVNITGFEVTGLDGGTY